MEQVECSPDCLSGDRGFDSRRHRQREAQWCNGDAEIHAPEFHGNQPVACEGNVVNHRLTAFAPRTGSEMGFDSLRATNKKKAIRP